MTIPVSETIYASRDAIRAQVVDFLQQYMELNEVDLTQSSFLSYIIDILTVLTSNLMFYQSNIYREFFLTQAQLPESIYNLSSFIGYSPKEAKYATCNLLMKVWLPFTDPNTTFNIPAGFKFKTSDGTVFITYYTVTVKVTNNTSVNISAVQNGKVFEIPVKINTTIEPLYFQFVLPTRQYKTVEQEFQIDDTLQMFQFTDINVPISGKVSNITIYVKEEGSTSEGRLYTQFNSLYLMSSSDYGYVLRVSAEGRRIYFGNGIIGKQPTPGATVIVYVDETLGSAGNVIAGSITKGERIYSQQYGNTTLIDYEVINPSPAFNGEDEEDLQQIRSNSIKSLVSLGRLVSEQDYKNFDVVIPNAPVKSNSIPVLKRSDLKVNEIQLFTIFEFAKNVVPSKNIFHDFPTSTTFVPRYTIINKDGVDYITLFEMTFDIPNEAVYYHYIMNEVTVAPTLIESWGDPAQELYHINANGLEIIANPVLPKATFKLSYYSTETNFADCTCVMKIISTDDTFTMTNVPGTIGGTFEYVFTNSLDIPSGNQLFYFTISNPSLPIQQLICQYSVNVTFRENLKAYMMSNTFVNGLVTTVYDIPVIQKSYYNSINKQDFESEVLQTLLSATDFKSYRMLTDFINLKLCDTTGISKNMTLNSPTKDSVIDIGLTSIPSTPLVGDRYIVSGNEGGSWNGQRDKIAICIDDIAKTWAFSEPKSSDIVYVINKGSNYIFSEYGWKIPLYDIPLKINLEVFKINDSSIGEADLIDEIRTVLVNYYKDNFGPKIDLRRSKIIDLVHNITGVSHCRLTTPSSDVFFNYNIDDFTQEQLLEYSPEWIYFSKSDITIKIFTLD